MIRTIKAYSLEVNLSKWAIVEAIARAYAAEKADHLQTFGNDRLFGDTAQYEQFRDALLDAGYVSPHGLQGRMWKLALKDAYETVLKNWASLAVDLRHRVQGHSDWSEAQKHYTNWLLKDERCLARLAGSVAPIANHIKLTIVARKQVQSYLRREARRHRGKRSQVRTARSFCLDADMYDLYQHNGRRYLSLMTLTPGKRLKIPLTGEHQFDGTIRVVLDREKRRLELHYTAAVEKTELLTGAPVAVDLGLSEVFTDEQGTHYGGSFGALLEGQSDEICDKGRKRRRLHALEKKARVKGNTRKANRIRRFNLGKKKQHRRQAKMQVEIARQVNTEINRLLDQRQPEFIVAEKLNIRGKAHSKRLSRRVSGWARGTVDERLAFKASAGGSSRKHVNPAYSSQTCPQCGYLHQRNRTWDAFQCQYCGHTDDADRVAANNLLARWNDPEITLYTPKARVRAIVLDRFTARLREAQADLFRAGLQELGSAGQPESETTGTIQ